MRSAVWEHGLSEWTLIVARPFGHAPYVLTPRRVYESVLWRAWRQEAQLTVSFGLVPEVQALSLAGLHATSEQRRLTGCCSQLRSLAIGLADLARAKASEYSVGFRQTRQTLPKLYLTSSSTPPTPQEFSWLRISADSEKAVSDFLHFEGAVRCSPTRLRLVGL